MPPHEGMIITRGLQEWACLLAIALPFENVARLLGWQTQEAQVLSSTNVRYVVRSHGDIIRQAEQAQWKAVLAMPDRSGLKPRLVPHATLRRRAAWPEELGEAVERALAVDDPVPPKGVSQADWERVLTARREEAAMTTADWRCLGPETEENQVLVSADEVLTCTGPQRSLLLPLAANFLHRVAGFSASQANDPGLVPSPQDML